MEAPLGKLVNETKSLETRIEDEKQQTKSLQSVLEDGSISSFTASDIDSLHQKSIHDINLCIEKIEELSMECKSLLSVIQDLERGNSEFLIEVGKKRSSELELGNSLVKDTEALQVVEADVKEKKPAGEVSSEYEQSAQKSATV